MAWKDSGDSVMYPDGSLVKGPKALCELQGYVYNAWVRMAEVFDALGKPNRAQELSDMATTTCPKCREPNVRRSHRRFLDFLVRSIGMVPLRCNVCEHRFFRFRRSLLHAGANSERMTR